MRKHFLTFSFAVTSLAGALIFLTGAVSANAFHTPEELHGFAWSSTVGWIGMNCADSASCATTPYKVVRTGDTLSGFAWSSSIGWISFTPEGPFPEAPQETARFTGDTLTGWARACTVFVSGCSGTLRPQSERGGWDGWIKLSGIAKDGNPYGVKLTGSAFSGFSFGADILQWIDWSKVTLSSEAPVVSTKPLSCGDRIEVWWSSVSGATSYRLYRGTSSSFIPSSSNQLDGNTATAGMQDFTSAPTSASPFTDTALSPATVYYYKVVAQKGAQTGAPSAGKSETTAPTICPDLIVESVSLTDANGVAIVGNPIVGTLLRFKAVIKNVGGGTTVQFNNQFVLDKKMNPTFSRLPLAGLGEKANTTLITSARTPWISTLGSHTIEVCADMPPAPYGAVDEIVATGNESNNCLTLPFTVTTPLSTTLECYDGKNGIYRTDYCVLDYGEQPKLRWNTTGSPISCTAKVDWDGARGIIGGILNLTLPPIGQSGNALEYLFQIECSR